jgi:hypothetical protein
MGKKDQVRPGPEAETTRAKLKARESNRERARGLKVASISAEARAAAKEAGLDDNRSVLLEVAKEGTVEDQLAKVQEIAARKTASRGKAHKQG